MKNHTYRDFPDLDKKLGKPKIKAEFKDCALKVKEALAYGGVK